MKTWVPCLLIRLKFAITAIIVLLQPMLAIGQGLEPEVRPYYEYVLFLRSEVTRDLVAEAEAIARPLLKHHRLINSTNIRKWNGIGPLPISFEHRIKAQNVYSDMETANGEQFSNILAEPLTKRIFGIGGSPVHELVVLIGVPRELNIPSYIEATQIAVAVARALKAPVYSDEETQRFERIEYLFNLPYEGKIRTKPPVLISMQNRPLIGMSGIIDQGMDGENCRTRGMRKLGLADLILNDWLPNNSPYWLISMVANLLVSGKLPSQANGLIEISSNDPDVSRALYGRGSKDRITALRLISKGVGANHHHSHLLSIEFDNFKHPTLYERQMQFNIDLVGNRFPKVLDSDAQKIFLAIARAKSKIKHYREKFDRLQKEGAQVFVNFSMELALKDYHEGKINKKSLQTWEQLMKWPKDTQITTRRWIGDPKFGGQYHRFSPPKVLLGETIEFLEFNHNDSSIEDILIVHKDGRTEGGEVTELLKIFSLL
jgi:hypothetical protein